MGIRQPIGHGGPTTRSRARERFVAALETSPEAPTCDRRAASAVGGLVERKVCCRARGPHGGWVYAGVWASSLASLVGWLAPPFRVPGGGA